MGSYDDAKTSELIGNSMLLLLLDTIKNNTGLYRDDGLAANKAKLRTIYNPKKTIMQHSLIIAVRANKKVP